MPYIKGSASSLDDLLNKIVNWATDANIHGDDAWVLKRQAPWPYGTILEAKGVNGKNKCYIGMMILNFTVGSTYRNWLLQTRNLAKYLIRHTRGLGLGDASFIHSNASTTFSVLSDKNDLTSKKTVYTLSNVEIVKVSGSALVFGVFKQYADGLEWHEQPGGMAIQELGLLPLNYQAYVEGSSYNQSNLKVAPPIYPGLGYPGIGMPAGQPATGSFDYWLTKDGCRIIVVTRNCDLANNRIAQWDVGHAGMISPFHAKMQYAFPAIAAGSCTGLRTVERQEFLNGLGVITKGTMVDYSYSNNSLSRSMPCAPCVNNSGWRTPEASQVMVCLPGGIWQCVSNWTQELRTRTEMINGQSTNYYFTVERPVRSLGLEIKPTNLELLDVAVGLAGENTVTLEPFDLVQRGGNMLGTIWRMIWPGLEGPYGEITINGKLCLMLPNCWEGRMWYVPDVKSGTINQETLMKMFAEIREYGKQYRMLVRLED